MEAAREIFEDCVCLHELVYTDLRKFDEMFSQRYKVDLVIKN